MMAEKRSFKFLFSLKSIPFIPISPATSFKSPLDYIVEHASSISV